MSNSADTAADDVLSHHIQRDRPIVTTAKVSPDYTATEIESPEKYARKVKMTFVFLFAMNFIRVFDNGILPAMTVTLKEENGLDEVQLGWLGSIVFVGEVVGSLFAIPIFQKVPIKFVLLTCILFQGVVLLLFALSDGHYETMVTSRFLTGVFQIFFYIHAPIWCDTHAPANKKTTWIMLIFLACTVGIAVGYLMTALVISCGAPWSIAFYLEILALLPVAYYIVTTERRFLGLLDRKVSNDGEDSIGASMTDWKQSSSTTTQLLDEIHSQLYRQRLRVQTEKTRDYGFWKQICYILSRLDFMVILVTLTCFYLSTQGIQYWFTDYLVSVLGQTKEQAFILNTVVSSTGYISGVALSGCIFDRIGGYHGRKSPVLFTSMLVVACCLGICSSLTHNVYIACSCILLQMVCWGLSLPVMIGYMIAQVPAKLRTQASSLANCSYSLLGLFPSSSVYGYVYKAHGGGQSRSGLLAIQLFGLASVLVLLPAIACKTVREWREINKQRAVRIIQAAAAAELVREQEKQVKSLDRNNDRESVKVQKKQSMDRLISISKSFVEPQSALEGAQMGRLVRMQSF